MARLTHQLSVKVDDMTHRKLELVCTVFDSTFAELVRDAIEMYLEHLGSGVFDGFRARHSVEYSEDPGGLHDHLHPTD